MEPFGQRPAGIAGNRPQAVPGRLRLSNVVRHGLPLGFFARAAADRVRGERLAELGEEAKVLAGGRKTVLGLLAAIAFHLGLMLFGWGFWFWSVPMLAMLVALLRHDFSLEYVAIPTPSCWW